MQILSCGNCAHEDYRVVAVPESVDVQELGSNEYDDEAHKLAIEKKTRKRIRKEQKAAALESATVTAETVAVKDEIIDENQTALVRKRKKKSKADDGAENSL